jgi:hypothetical protein
VNYGPLCVFHFRNFHVFPCLSGVHYDFEIYFNLNGYFSFTTTTLDSGNVKISGNLKQKLFLGFFFENPSHFHTNWLIFEGLATKCFLIKIKFPLVRRLPANFVIRITLFPYNLDTSF